MAATTSPACATTATRRRTPTQWRSFASRPAHSARNTANSPPAVVSVITKSGTNQWHGGLFEFNRNTDFNANSWVPAHNAAGQIIVSPYHRNQFGGDVGGPIKKDKAFFFFSYGGIAPGNRSRVYRRHHAHGRTSAWATLPRTPSRSTRRAQRISQRTRWTERTPAPIARLPR